MSIFRFLLAALAISTLAHGQIAIDASAPPAAPHALAFETGGRSPDGHVLAVNGRYFTRDGQPWFPVMGEFHFARYPASEWEAELQKMKAGGIDIVATYVFWIFHEEKEGHFDWTGQRDLRKFIELCGKTGLSVWLRVGPWDHGEARNGGFPDWLVAAGPTRENAPGYLGHVQQFFGQIGQQVRGQFWKDGGPIVGVQLENEYHPAQDGEAHMLKLLELARGAGLDAPFYTATGWDHAVVPAAPFLPVFGGYTEQFWSDSRTELPPNQNFFFTTIRAEDNVGYLLQPKDRAYHDRYVGYPFLTAEMGGGMAIAYHRRPVMQAADSTAAALVKLGSGITLLGYYMYHGGTNPDSQGPVHESFTGWNAYNELETKSYDFQAPLGEFGEMRDTYRTTKELHLFLHDFGAQLAPMTAYFPNEKPRSLDDAITPRVALRSDGTAGFLFINNHQRSHPLPAQRNFQATIKLAAGTITIPQHPVTLPSGVYTHWPLNLPLGGATLRSATAQLLAHLSGPETFVFGATPGVPAEFVIAGSAAASVASSRGHVTNLDGAVAIDEIEPGRDAPIVVKRADGTLVKIVLLSHDDALNLWKTPLAGRDRLLISQASLRFAGDRLDLESNDPHCLTVAIFPAIDLAGDRFEPVGARGLFAEYTVAKTPHRYEMAAVKSIAHARPAMPVKLNSDPKRPVALQPNDADFAGAATWTIQLPAPGAGEEDRALLRVHYRGDVARLYAGDRLLADNFYKGTPFEFGLWRLTAEERRAGLTLKVLPLRRGAPIYLPREAWPKFDASGEAVELDQVEVVPVYSATLSAR